jgi:acyl transferase domain-containing protein/NAD(P)H-dependent flavin oxidoreductase YrpB (nitropropane dioxygenase family)
MQNPWPPAHWNPRRSDPQPTPGAPTAHGGRDLILVLTPFEVPNPGIAAAAVRAGALGILDLGRDRPGALEAINLTVRWAHAPFGVRVPPGCPVGPEDLPDQVDTVVLPAGLPIATWQNDRRRVLVEVVSVDEASRAARDGAAGVIARGSECAGRSGELSTFVLLQRLAAEAGQGRLEIPVWAAGGIGLHTAAAAVVSGAAGVVLDVQVALTTEAVAHQPAALTQAIAGMDGSETVVLAGHRVFTRPDLAGPEEAAALSPAGMALRLGTSFRVTPGKPAQWLPVGQDGALAKGLAARFRTTGGIVAAVRSSIDDHLAAAVSARPLAPGAGIARGGAFSVPVAQGPMTRVSDRAGFAAAVADGGGLPFLALALMSGDEVAGLLAEAAGPLAGRAWGVGILGFVPPELREAQLDAVRAARPPYALIAGGRPTQAVSLEAAGIGTFLHVPSPGLLDRFLADGARRFVFEGSECGGHIGPRASFPLWEAQIERLLAFGATPAAGPTFFDDLEVLFAGGVHDERSAAMVAAMTGPLAARGAAIGVLMGTAYLFTEEAVATGAILPGFQQTALDCAATVLLETSPGHVTRCADTPYVAAFTKAREELAAAGTSAKELWAELESLNLGRLRIASRGIRREGDALVPVPAAEQHEAGMYMLGQVATVRSEPTTVAALHAQVTEGACRFLDAAAAARGIGPEAETTPDEIAEAGRPLDIAIVGMACVLPQADGLASYWANILAGVDAVTEVPADRWDPERYYDADAYRGPGTTATPSKWGGFIPAVPFDALAYGIPPSSLAAIEPVQLLALEVASRALADAGYADRPFDRERASAVFGAEGGTDLAGAYGFRALFPSYFGELPPELDKHLPALTEDSFPGVLANVIAGRIANRLDLGGVNFTIDAACASSLAALDVGCKELVAGSSDLVLCGGADLHNGIYDYLMFASAHALSPTGRCRTFDATADGIALGEGVVCVVLKRLADAERDGDRVYAVIKAVAGSSDGRSLGLTAPRPEGQRRALQRAYRMAGVSPADVGLIEAHGTGTVVGDRTELAALTQVFFTAGASPATCGLGSVKSQIGHTKCAAGLAGLVKVAKALHTGVRPPTGRIADPNPGWEAGASPFFFDQEARPWASPPGQRFAGVSAFGFGGTNFHAVLSGYDGAPEPAHGLDEWPAELILISGVAQADAMASLDRLSELLAANDVAGRPFRLRDVAAALTQGTAPVHVAFVADDLDDLAAKAAAARAGQAAPSAGIFAAGSAPGGPVAFLYPGQGSQRPGMMADLFVAFPRLQRHLHGAASRYTPTMFPPAALSPAARAAQKAAITDTAVAQPVMGIADVAMHELLASLGVHPDMAGGHSYGEFPALAAAGAFNTNDLLALGEARAAAILAAAGDDPGTMAAVQAGAGETRAVLEAAGIDGVVIANHNAPDQVVISGPTRALTASVEALGAAGLTARPIPVACAFHSPVVAAAAGGLAKALAGCELSAPAYPVWSNTTAQPHQAGSIATLLARQVAEPVRFVEQVESMYSAGARVFVEAGPGRVLTGLVGKILSGRPHTAVACEVSGEAGLRRFLLALAELAAAGVPVDTDVLFRGRDILPAAQVTIPALPARPAWVVDGHLVRTVAGEALAGGLRSAREFTGAPLAAPPAHVPGDPARDAAVMEFLRATRETIAAQREVMLGYLGAPALPTMAREVASAPLPASVPTQAPTAVPPPEAAPRVLTEERLLEAIIGIVGQRTGYPREMLGATMDLEADLSIDSIKRTEIIMELSEQMRLAPAGAAPGAGAVEALAKLKTIGAIVAWILDHHAAGDAPPQPASPAQEEPAAPVAPQRYVVEVTTAKSPALDALADLAGHRFVVVDSDHAGETVGTATATALRKLGAESVLLGLHHDTEAACAAVDGVIHLGALRPGASPVLPHAFATLRAALLGGARWLVVATASGGRFGHGWEGGEATDPTPGLGMRGLARTIAREYPDVMVRAVDIDPEDTPERIAEHLVREIAAVSHEKPDGSRTRHHTEPVVGYLNGSRCAINVSAAPLAIPRNPGGLATATVEAAMRDLGLDSDSVVLLTGGGRGITATCAIALGAACGCRVELLGRSPSPERPEHPDTAAAADASALRRALVAQGISAPIEVEAALRRILASRELNDTLATLAPITTSVRYHSVDVSDAVAVRNVVEEIYGRWGRIDGVIHGAGVIEDRMLADKTPESFRRVFSTKVDGARALAAAFAGRDPVRFFALFGSVSGVFGNPGQVDYSAANDALDTLARMWSASPEDRIASKVVSLDWGPWASTAGGMVSPELEREYARRGIGMIAPGDGVAALFSELAWGDVTHCQVVYMGGSTDPFSGAKADGADG